MRKFFLFLAAAIIMTSFCVAVDADDVCSGACGDNVTWRFDPDTGTLTITGMGEMWDAGKNWSPEWGVFSSEIKTVIFERGVTNVGAYLFNKYDNDSYKLLGYENLERVVISDTVKRIGLETFENCKKLSTVYIGYGVDVIIEWAFAGCDALTTVYYAASPADWDKIWENEYYDGYSYDGLSVSGLDNKTVVYYTGLCGDTVTWHYAPDTQTLTIAGTGDMWFYDFHAPIEEYGKAPWQNPNMPLRSVIIEEGVTNVGGGAFYCCRFDDIHIPESVTYIEAFAFENSNVKNVVIPDKVTVIEMEAFAHCSNLERITLPSGLKRITDYAFYECDHLKDVYFRGTETEWEILSDGYQYDPLGDYPIIFTLPTVHFNSCIGAAEHSFAAAWAVDAASHWHECAVCGAKSDIIPHDPDESGRCRICAPLLGNLDGDGTVSASDAVYLLYAVFFPGDFPVTQDCDFNGDGQVNAEDAIYLLYHVFFEEDYPLA